MKIKSFKELDVWKKGMDIVDCVYEATARFPKEERYGLATHIQRTAVSIPSNVAEGFARQHTKEYIQFCYVALGSCAELETQLIIAQRRNYVSKDMFLKLEDYLDHESRMLMNLIKSLKISESRNPNHETRKMEEEK
ncbi:MAG: four helix bundle protein [Halobacteriota archaeon]